MPSPSRIFPCACANARRLARVLTQVYDARLRDSGLEAPQFSLLMLLDLAGPCSQTQLSRHYDMEKTTVSRNLKLLESKGWISLSTVQDKRVRQFELTSAGRKRLAAAKPAWKKAQDDLLAEIGEAHWGQMFQTLQAVVSAAKNMELK